ncbi:hypothetical protein AX14_000776 [Amanita brunnescens Koide BX004]|nr:hypothetical protein AX14_000776 [Amanita brunnescens Koide BX004]
MSKLGKPDLLGYDYSALSSLALTAHYSTIPRQDKEPDGAPTSLACKIDAKEMGSHAMQTTLKDLEKKKKKAADGKDRDAMERQLAKGRTEASLPVHHRGNAGCGGVDVPSTAAGDAGNLPIHFGSGSYPVRLVIRGEGEKAKGVKADKGIVSPHVLDGFWVQRQISGPGHGCQQSSPARRQLIELFEFLSFHTVIVWYTKLAHSNADERVHVEVAMRETGAGWILRELAGDRQIKATTDIIDVGEVKPEVPKIAMLGDQGGIYHPQARPSLKQAIPSRIPDRRANFTLCAQGAGKTNIAMLRILSELAKAKDKATGTFGLDSFKIIPQ